MAFRFQWPYFSDEFIQQAKTMLTNALNKGNKPAVIVDHITVKELDMGTLPPELEMLEMGELSMERFRGIFKLTYNGDAHVVLQTKVQANPMNVKKTDNPSYTRRGILAADQPLVVPMLLRISDFKLRGIIVLVVDQIKGITLVFKNDPLESVLVSSTFDSITPIQRFLQSEIEKQLRNLFQEDLPTAIHNLSQQFTKKPEDVSRQHSQDDHHHNHHHGSKPGIYDGGLGTPMVSRSPSRRSSTVRGTKKTPGKTSSEPDLSAGVHYDDEGLKPPRKPTSATVRSESPGSRTRRDPHTEYSGDAERDLLQESLNHHANLPTQERSSRTSSRRSSRADRYENPDIPTSSSSTQQERIYMRDNYVQSSLGIAESTHLANQFANLIHSNQTISPYAQNLEHFAFRSVPPKRPASVQYFGHNSSYRAQPLGSKGGPVSVNGSEISKDGLGNLNNSTGHLNAYTQYRNVVGGHGQSSPRISHRRLQGRVGIRRYGMQMGGGGGPRELSDHDSDEYNDVDEALSESEYVYVERQPRTSTDSETQRSHELNGQTGSSKNKLSPPPSTSLQTIDGSSSASSSGPSPVSRPQLIRRRSPSYQNPSPSDFSDTMPGSFSSSVDPRAWAPSNKQPTKEGNTRTEARPASSQYVSPQEEVLHRQIAAMKLNGRQLSPSSRSPFSTPAATPLSPTPIGSSPFATPTVTSPTSGYTLKLQSGTTTTARTFSNTQRHSQASPRPAPPEALKRDKRNSSILSSRRMSSVGIGLGVLSKEGDKGISLESRPSRPSKPITAHSGWSEPDST
ncbi:ERMES complex subunit [Mortierella sp. AD011]|nr:ERMES complex subunit [Mortierella sp. AD010]KAF9399546.1 ERMES complex subunit [Mortierella sp. AD011]